MSISRIRREGAVFGDAMCGGGGTSRAIHQFVQEAGIRVKRFVAINHDPDAIETHEANFPGVVHYCQDVGHVDLQEAFPEGYMDFLWGSPTCTQHSRARGGKPINDQLRNGPWQLLTIATEIYVERIAIENVPEFVDWAPIGVDGHAIKSRRGETFQALIAAFEGIGYRVEWRITDAANYGAATTRSRFLALLVKRGKGRIIWAPPTHSETGESDLFHGDIQPWVGARKHLDLSLPTKPVIGRKVPLAAPTLARGWHGMKQLWPAAAVRVYTPDVRDAAIEGLAYCNAGIVKAHAALKKARSRSKPVPNAAAKRKALTKRIERLNVLIERYDALLVKVREYLAQPLTLSSGALQPFLITLRGTSDTSVRASSSTIDEPSNGIVAGGGHLMIAAPMASEIVGANRAHNVPRLSDTPAPGVTTSTGGGLYLVRAAVEPLVLGQHGGGSARAAGKPTSTITQDGAVSLFAAEAQEIITVNERDTDRKSSKSLPGTVPAQAVLTRDRLGVVQAIVQPFYGAKNGVPRASQLPEKPLRSQTTENRFGILAPCLVQTNHTADEERAQRRVDQPVSYVATRNGIGLADAGVEPTDEDLAALSPSLRERLLVGEDGRLHIARLHFRMLSPAIEIAPIMGFPRDYKWPSSNTKITKLVGNAVNVEWAYAHVKWFLSDWVPEKSSEEVA